MLTNLLQSLRGLGRPAPSFMEIRREIYALGGRHKGEPLQGALEELKTAGPGSREAMLLQAVVLKLQTS